MVLKIETVRGTMSLITYRLQNGTQHGHDARPCTCRYRDGEGDGGDDDEHGAAGGVGGL